MTWNSIHTRLLFMPHWTDKFNSLCNYFERRASSRLCAPPICVQWLPWWRRNGARCPPSLSNLLVLIRIVGNKVFFDYEKCRQSVQSEDSVCVTHRICKACPSMVEIQCPAKYCIQHVLGTATVWQFWFDILCSFSELLGNVFKWLN